MDWEISASVVEKQGVKQRTCDGVWGTIGSNWGPVWRQIDNLL